MSSQLAADLVVVLHALFILFVICGAALLSFCPRLIWLHLPAALWGALIEFSGWICPLTPLENRLRRLAGEQGYAGSFVEEYVIPIVYPAQLTRELQIWIGAGVVLINLILYGMYFFQPKPRSR